MDAHSTFALRQKVSVIAVGAALFAGCATTRAPTSPAESLAARALRQARSSHAPTEERAGLYLQAAAITSPQLGSGRNDTPAREIYNSAAAELTVLLRSADGGRWWNHPLTLTGHESAYQLRFQPGTHDVTWPPDYFTKFVRARDVRLKVMRKRNIEDGVGGALVGVRKKTPPETFARPVGVTAPVTAALDFHGNQATLTLRDPRKQPKAIVAGAVRPLAADFTAPLAYYPTVNEFWTGLMGALRVSHYMGSTGLYLDQPM